jgi:hypothetical protein
MITEGISQNYDVLFGFCINWRLLGCILWLEPCILLIEELSVEVMNRQDYFCNCFDLVP